MIKIINMVLLRAHADPDFAIVVGVLIGAIVLAGLAVVW